MYITSVMYMNPNYVIFSQPEQVAFGHSLTTLQSFHIPHNATTDNFLLEYLCLVNAHVCQIMSSVCHTVFVFVETKPEKHPSRKKCH